MCVTDEPRCLNNFVSISLMIMADSKIVTVITDPFDKASLSEEIVIFLKNNKFSVENLLDFIKTSEEIIRNDGIEVNDAGVRTVKDLEESESEYLKIIFVLVLPFEQILNYQEKFYDNHLEGLVNQFFQKRGMSTKNLVEKFMQRFNISFDDSFS